MTDSFSEVSGCFTRSFAVMFRRTGFKITDAGIHSSCAVVFCIFFLCPTLNVCISCARNVYNLGGSTYNRGTQSFCSAVECQLLALPTCNYTSCNKMYGVTISSSGTISVAVCCAVK